MGNAYAQVIVQEETQMAKIPETLKLSNQRNTN